MIRPQKTWDVGDIVAALRSGTWVGRRRLSRLVDRGRLGFCDPDGRRYRLRSGRRQRGFNGVVGKYRGLWQRSRAKRWSIPMMTD